MSECRGDWLEPRLSVDKSVKYNPVKYYLNFTAQQNLAGIFSSSQDSYGYETIIRSHKNVRDFFK